MSKKVNVEWTGIRIPRRTFLKGSSALSAAALAGTFFPRLTWADGSTLTTRTYADMRSLDPAFSHGVVDEEIQGAIYNKLIQSTPGSEWGWQLDAAFWTLGDENAGDGWKNVELILNRFSMTPDPYYATAWFTTDQVGVWNWERFSSAEFDQLHADAQVERDNEKRAAMYRKAQDLMEESAAYRFITHAASPVIHRNSIVPALRPDGLPLLRYFRKA